MAGKVTTAHKIWPWRVPQMAAGGLVALRNNPIITKELRQRMRSWWGLGSLAIATFALSLFALLVYGSFDNSYNYRYSASGNYYASATPRSEEIGTNYFLAIVIAQLFLACILAPNFTGATIAGEKERQTYDVLLVTLLRPRDIIIGKLFASLSYLLLVILAGVPIASVAFLMGGVGPDQLIAAIIVLLLNGILLGTIGIFWSSVMRTSRWAGGNAFFNILILLFGIPFGIIATVNIFFRSWSLGFPIYAETLGRDILGWLLSINPVYAIMATDQILKSRAGSNILYFSNNPGGWTLTPFSRFVILALVVSAIYLRLATQRIKPLSTPGKRPKKAKSKAKAGNFQP